MTVPIHRLPGCSDPPFDGVRPPQLHGGEFFLDAHVAADAEAMLAGSDPENVRWINEGHESSVEENRTAVERWRLSWRDGGDQRTWAIRETATGRLAGGCELRLQGAGVADFSYWIFPQFRGRRWASRALTLIVDHAFGGMAIARAQLLIEVGNAASQRVAADAGFRREGVLRDLAEHLGERHDMVIYSRLPADPPPPPPLRFGNHDAL